MLAKKVSKWYYFESKFESILGSKWKFGSSQKSVQRFKVAHAQVNSSKIVRQLFHEIFESF